RPRDARATDLRAALGVAELDLPAPERGRPRRRTEGLRPPRAREIRLEADMIDLDARIPNNVDLAGDTKLRRALESWQPGFQRWWNERGPEGLQRDDIYLRTAVSV